jgi:predicted GNAT family acetyltransferase
MDTQVANATERSRYELFLDGQLVGVADYRVLGDRVVMPHTEIVPPLRGRGLGELLVGHALDDVRAAGRTVVPSCWFVADFIDANPDYRDLLAS